MPQSTLTDDQRAALLGSVITVAEAVTRYHLAPKNVSEAIRMGWIRGRHSGRVWLLLLDDCERRWGYRREGEADE